jgi:uncharacterized protein (DUF58 family)
VVLSRRGASLAAAAVVLIVAGRLLGVPELYALAVTAAALVVGALVYVRYYPWQLEAHREVRPPQVSAQGASRVELSVRNTDTRRSPVLSARDPFDGGRRWARFHIAPLEPGELVRAAYRLPTGERGIFPLGPLEIGVADPFGLAQRKVPAAALATLTVYPQIDDIRPLPQARSTDPSGYTSQPSVGAGGEDFYALRPYELGDDLRRVHWPSTARQDELMIRQDELPWQGRVTVLADLRGEVHTPASLELVLSAVASIVRASIANRRQVRLCTTDGTDTGYGGGQSHLQAVLEYLAGADVHPTAGLRGIVAVLARGFDHGALATVTTDQASDEDLGGLLRLSSRYGSDALVVFAPSAWDPAGRTTRDRPLANPRRVIRVTSERPFAAEWDRAMASPARRVGALR